MRNRLAAFVRTVRDRCEELVMILAYALDDGPIEHEWSTPPSCALPGLEAFLAAEAEVEELHALVALFPRCTECGGDVEANDWNARLSPSRRNRVAHVACPFSLEVPDDAW